MSADVKDVRRFAFDLRKTGIRSRVEVRAVVQKLCADTQADAQALSPVDTGFLRSSITYTINDTPVGTTGEVGPTADYGDYVESGTSRMGPQPYMLPAFTRQLAVLHQLGREIGIVK